MIHRHFSDELSDHLRTFEALRDLETQVAEAAQVMARTLTAGGKLLICGNGGSAADAQHFAAEMVGRFVNDRRALAAIALTTDTSALTAIGNDYGFDQIFSRQVLGLAQPGDCLVLISTSGNSANLIQASDAARSIGARCIGLLGRDGGRLASRCDTALVVPSHVTARIQEAHIFLIHALCAAIERSLGLEGQS
jgi:D-sedoheptulose 7-phosphate isomerase